MDNNFKFIYFIHREYSLRHIFKSEFYDKLSINIENLVDFCREYFSKNKLDELFIVEDETKRFDINFEIDVIDLILDIYVAKINNEKYYCGITDYYYNKNFNDSGDDLGITGYLDDFYMKLMSEKSRKESLKFIYKISAKYNIYASHAKYLHKKKYCIKNIFSDIDSVSEKRFFCFKKFDDYYKYFSPSEVICGLDVDECSCVKGSYAMFVDFASPDFDIDRTLDYIQTSIVDTLLMMGEVDGRELSVRELEYLSRNCKVIRQSSFDISGLQNRVFGLIMWDLVNIRGCSPRDAFGFLIKNNDYLEYVRRQYSYLSEDEFIGERMCDNKKIYINALKAFNNADECVNKCMIISTNSRVNRKNKNIKNYDAYMEDMSFDFKNDGVVRSEIDRDLLQTIYRKTKKNSVICYEKDDEVGLVKNLAKMVCKKK